jgi:hypothetical protein
MGAGARTRAGETRHRRVDQVGDDYIVAHQDENPSDIQKAHDLAVYYR